MYVFSKDFHFNEAKRLKTQDEGLRSILSLDVKQKRGGGGCAAENTFQQKERGLFMITQDSRRDCA